MTLCVGALCTEPGGNNAIVLAADSRLESPWFGANTGFKLSWAGLGTPALFAGKVAAARELLSAYQTATEGQLLDLFTVEDLLRKPAEAQKKALADHYVRMKLGISFDDFMMHGRVRLSGDMFRRTEQEIADIGLDCELIIGGFCPPTHRCKGYLCTVEADGTVQRSDDFAVIGSGSIAAQANMFSREHEAFHSLRVALYHVYETMQLAANAPGVGGEVNMAVVRPRKDGQGVDCFAVMDLAPFKQCFDRFGPKPLRGITERLEDTVKDIDELPSLIMPTVPRPPKTEAQSDAPDPKRD